MYLIGTIASSLLQNVDNGVMDPLQVITIGPTSASSINFTNIPSTYTHLQLRIMALGTGATAVNGFNCQANGDTGNNYARHLLQGYGSGVDAYGIANTDRFQFFGYRGGLRDTYPTAAVIDFFDYANTNKYKTARGLAGNDFNGNATPVTGEVQLSSGMWMNTNAISSLSVYISGSSFGQYSQFALYGIKAAS
jgi:hypothetical protein